MRKKTNWLILVIPAIALFISVLVYSNLPETIPIHFNVQGQADGFAPKIMALFQPLAMLGISLLLTILPKLDPRAKSYEKFNKTYWIINVCTLLFMLFIHCWILAVSLGMESSLSMEYILPVLVGVLFIVIGNLLPKIRQNYMVGVKTIWAFNDPDNWNKTNRFGGKSLVVAGFLLFFSGFIPIRFRLVYVVSLILTSAFLPIIYSYYLFYKKTRGN